MVIVIIGAGAGRTTIGRALAAELGWAFVDADDVHPSSRAATNHATLRAIVARALDRRESLVLASPPLDDGSRDALREGLRPVRFVFLEARTGRERLAADDALHIDAAQPPERILAAMRIEFGV